MGKRRDEKERARKTRKRREHRRQDSLIAKLKKENLSRTPSPAEASNGTLLDDSKLEEDSDVLLLSASDIEF